MTQTIEERVREFSESDLHGAFMQAVGALVDDLPRSHPLHMHVEAFEKIDKALMQVIPVYGKPLPQDVPIPVLPEDNSREISDTE